MPPPASPRRRRVPPTSRLAQIVEWLQGGDDGQPSLVVFDEVSQPQQAAPSASPVSEPGLPLLNPCHVLSCLNLGLTCRPDLTWPPLPALPLLSMLCSATRPRTCCPPLGRSPPRRPRRWWSCRWGGVAAARGGVAVECSGASQTALPLSPLQHCPPWCSLPCSCSCSCFCSCLFRPAGAAARRQDPVQLRHGRLRAPQPGLHEPPGAVWVQGPVRDDRAAQQVSE